MFLVSETLGTEITTAIVVTAYDRPEKLRLTLESLSGCLSFEKFTTFINVDGSKGVSDFELVSKSERVARNFAKANPNVMVVPRDRNLGLAGNVRLSVNEALTAFDSVIVVEDDLLLSIHFLNEMQSQLIKNQTDTSIFSISGHSLPIFVEDKTSWATWYFSSWGWATWKNRWDQIDWQVPDPTSYREWASLDLFGFRRNRQMLRFARENKIDSWAIYVFASNLRQGLTSIFPGRSLVNNIGLDGSGVHGDNTTIYDTVLATVAPFESDGYINVPRKTLRREMLFQLTTFSAYTLAISLMRFVFFLPAFIATQLRSR
jgi:hypothetical protein